jgi:hypothetical protein
VKIDKFLEIVIGKINKVKNEYFESLNKKINNPEKNNNEL